MLFVKVKKAFESKGKFYEKGDVIEVPVFVFHKLSLRGLVTPFNPDIPEEEIPLLKAEFERLFTEHMERLKKIPVALSEMRQRKPETYQKLRQLETEMDEAWLTFDYDKFKEALTKIEKTISEAQYEKV